MSKHDKKAKPRSGPAIYPDITAQARDLGVSRVHLYLVLSGKRKSARLTAAWRKLTSRLAA